MRQPLAKINRIIKTFVPRGPLVDQVAVADRVLEKITSLAVGQPVTAFADYAVTLEQSLPTVLPAVFYDGLPAHLKKKRVFNVASYDYSPEDASERIAVFADLQGDLPWALLFEARLGATSTVHGTLSVYFGHASSIRDLVAKRVAEMSADNLKFFLENSAGILADPHGFLPVGNQTVYDRLAKEFYASEFGQRFFSALQREDLLHRLPVAEAGQPTSGAPSHKL